MEAGYLKKITGTIDVKDRKTAHRRAQDRLCAVGKDLGFGAIAEYFAPNLTSPERNSYIDVAWVSNSQIAIAFEIHVRKSTKCLVQPTGIKDFNKLRKLRAAEKFIVNISEVSGEAFFHKIEA